MLAVAASCLVVAACSGDFQFSQLEGFESLRNQFGENLPTSKERRLLVLHKPEIHLPPGHEGPIDFYEDYVAHGELRDGNSKLISAEVTPEILNRYRNDPEAQFIHVAPVRGTPVRPVVYGSASRHHIPFLGGNYTFLSYHAVFRTSGLPLELGPFRETLVRTFGDRRDWHQLDHYTAVFIVLDPSLNRCAVLLQQHNYMRTYLVDNNGPFNREDPVRIDVAIDSNELYPHSAQRRKHRAVGFMAPNTIDFLLNLTDDMPFQGSFDVTEGSTRIDYQLRHLVPNDAFYVFEGRLGERRQLPGRDGPPGAMYNTWPALKPYHVMLPAFYWEEGDETYAHIIRNLDPNNLEAGGILQELQDRFKRAAQMKGVCSQ